MASLKYVLMFERDLPKAIHFFKSGLGASVNIATEKWAELKAGSTILALKETEGEAQCNTGYSPMLVFDVQDVQDSLTKMLSLGARMDGAVQYTLDGSKRLLQTMDLTMYVESLSEEERKGKVNGMYGTPTRDVEHMHVGVRRTINLHKFVHTFKARYSRGEESDEQLSQVVDAMARASDKQKEAL
eukprot:jgi/Picsp_1/4682/NSC_02051-R1_protein